MAHDTRTRAGGAGARKVALDALVRIDAAGAYANLVLPPMLSRRGLEPRDRALATELVYGVTRMRRACDWLVDRFLISPVEPAVRAALRIGAYQLVFLDLPPHAAVDTAVAVAPARARGLVNAVLRKVSGDTAPHWPDDGTRLSYPDWIVARVRLDLGEADADAALVAMNQPLPPTTRPDGYVQDDASRLVADAVGAHPESRIADVCAAPGGKATALAATGAWVVASDQRAGRARLVATAKRRLAAATLDVVVADAGQLPYRPEQFDRVLADAPCSGLGSLRRRPDARWRIDEDAPSRLAALQVRLLRDAARVLAPGGALVYSVCTFTDAETVAVDDVVARELPHLVPEPLDAPWTPRGRGFQLLPSSTHDGMFVIRYRDGR